jgi:hypothetical protein
VPKEKNDLTKTNLPLIRCECGAEFLLLPDLTEMSKVIGKHAQMHKENVKDKREAEEVFHRIEDCLLAQILEKASQLG